MRRKRVIFSLVKWSNHSNCVSLINILLNFSGKVERYPIYPKQCRLLEINKTAPEKKMIKVWVYFGRGKSIWSPITTGSDTFGFRTGKLNVCLGMNEDCVISGIGLYDDLLLSN